MASCEDDFSRLGDTCHGDDDASEPRHRGGGKENSNKDGGEKREKRKDRSHDDLGVGASDGESPSAYPYSLSRSGKKQLQLQLHESSSSSRGAAEGEKAGEREREREYRKDREEWSDSAIQSLLDAYTQRFELLNRGNLRGRDWEDVAAVVSQRCDRDKGKTVEQCKNKIDNLKKRFKVELHRLTTGGLSTSHWPWFSKLELIVSTSSNNSSKSQTQTTPPPPHDEDRSPSASASAAPARHSKRHHTTAALAQAGMRFIRAASPPKLKWKRVLFKISGAAIAGPAPHNVDPKVIMLIAREIQVASRQGVQVAVVIGGRNIFCGDSWIAATGVDKAATFQICMMASVMNAMLLQASLEKIGVATRVQTALTMQEVAEPYIRRKAMSHLDKGRVVIFGGIASGLGNPLFTTDAAAALRASEIDADAVLKGISGDVLYGCHPGNTNSSGFEHISYREFVSRGFTPMDTTAIAFCEENNIPVVLFNLLEPGNISRALAGDQIGTLIDQSGRIG